MSISRIGERIYRSHICWWNYPILLLQDDKVPDHEFFKDGKWVEIPFHLKKKTAIFVYLKIVVESEIL
jgi:hypothetical protein